MNPLMHQAPIYIIGAGSVGCLFAAMMKRVGLNCVLIVRDPSLSQLSISLKPASTESSFQITDAVTVDCMQWSHLHHFPEHATIIDATKTLNLDDVIEQVTPRLLPTHRLISAQNGIGVEDYVRNKLASATAAEIGRAVCWFGVRMSRDNTKPSAVTLFVAGIDSVEFYLPKSYESFSSLLRQSGFPPTALSTPQDVEWRKGLWNVSMNAICALTNRENGAAALDPELRPLADRLFNEAALVAEAEGVKITPEIRERCFQGMITTGKNLNSTLMDLKHNRPTEIEWLNGAVVKTGKKHGISCPTHETITTLIRVKQGD